MFSHILNINILLDFISYTPPQILGEMKQGISKTYNSEIISIIYKSYFKINSRSLPHPILFPPKIKLKENNIDKEKNYYNQEQ